MATPGRKKTLSDEQRNENKKKSIIQYRTKHKENYNDYMNEYMKKKNKQKKEEEKKKLETNPYSIIPERFPESKEIMRKVSELIKIGCSEKSTKGTNYHKITAKNCVMDMMMLIGFKYAKDVWVSRSYYKIPMYALGWLDVKKNSIYFDKMVIYGRLKWILKLDDERITNIMGQLKFHRYYNEGYHHHPIIKKDGRKQIDTTYKESIIGHYIFFLPEVRHLLDDNEKKEYELILNSPKCSVYRLPYQPDQTLIQTPTETVLDSSTLQNSMEKI